MRRSHRKKYIRAIGVVLVLVFLFGIAKVVDTYHEGDGEPIADIRSLDSSLRIEYSVFAEEQPLILLPAIKYLEKNGTETLQSIKNEYRYNVDRLDVGLPVTISYEIKGMPTGSQVAAARLEVSEDEAFTAPRRFNMEGTLCSAEVSMLKVNTLYYFRITIELSNGVETATIATFRTADTVRILSIDGVPNVRDIGGWKTADGQVIRQGLLFRGAELDGAVKTEYQITETGIDHMVHILKVRTELDLRDPAVTTVSGSMLGDSVRRVSIFTAQYGDVFKSANQTALRQVFGELAKEKAYPIYLHDTYGMDQTGTVCYLLEALLGVGEEDLMRDYRASILYHGGLHNSEMNDFVERFNNLPGETAQDKAEGFLLEIGVTAEEIAAIRAILLEPAQA